MNSPHLSTLWKQIITVIICLSVQQDIYAQKKTTSDSIAISTTQKAPQPSLKENEYIIKYPNGAIERIQDKLTREEILWLESAEKQGIKKAYDDMYNLLLNVMVKKEQNPRTASSKLITSSEYSMNPAYYRWLTRRLIGYGYTLENITELQQQTNINVFSEAMNAKKKYARVLFSSLIVVGTIDSAYNDTSFDDGYSVSIAITVKETLRGDTTIKHPIIRAEGKVWPNTSPYRKSTFKNKTFDTPSPHDFQVRGSNYIFFLDKSEYENKIYQWKADRRMKDAYKQPVNIRTDAEAVYHRRDCYKTSRHNIPLTKWDVGSNIDSTEDIDETEKMQAEEIRKLCAEIAPILRQLNIK